MAHPDYKKMYEEMWEKARELSELRADLEGRLGDISKELEVLHETMNHLAPLAGYTADPFDDDIKNFGITDAVRAVLDDKTRMSAADVRAKMQERGFDFSKYSAPDATVRTILHRMVGTDKLLIEKDGWKTFYRLRPKPLAVEITDADIPF